MVAKKLAKFSRYLFASALQSRYSFGMPGQRRSPGPHGRESWLPRLAGIGVIVLLAAGGVTGYLLAAHPHPAHRAPLPDTVLSHQSVGLVARNAQPGKTAGELLQLVGSPQLPQFTAVAGAQATDGSPQWTADQMAGNSYIFIFLPTGECLAAGHPVRSPRLLLQHCDLSAAQRWRRASPAALSQGHEFYQYANVGDGFCLTDTGLAAGQVYGAALAACKPSAPASQLIAFWWLAV
jgi:hypothetical protein